MRDRLISRCPTCNIHYVSKDGHRCLSAATPPDPKDPYIAHTETQARYHQERHQEAFNLGLKLEAERDQLRARVRELEAELTLALPELKRVNQYADAARAECQSHLNYAKHLQSELGDTAEALSDSRAAIQRLEAAAGRMRWHLEQIILRTPGDGTTTQPIAIQLARKALAETDAGTRALAVIEAARKLIPLDCTPDIVFRPAWDSLADALSAWDQGAKPSGGKGDGNGER